MILKSMFSSNTREKDYTTEKRLRLSINKPCLLARKALPITLEEDVNIHEKSPMFTGLSLTRFRESACVIFAFVISQGCCYKSQR